MVPEPSVMSAALRRLTVGPRTWRVGAALSVRSMSTFNGLYHTGGQANAMRRRMAPKVYDAATDDENKDEYTGKFIKGEVLDYAINLRTSRPGTVIDIPYELTLTESLHEFWQSCEWCRS